MNRTITAALALALLASPAALWAKESPKAEQILQHFVDLSTDEVEVCADFDKYDARTREKACDQALDAISDGRDRHRNPSPGEAANYDYWQVTLQAAQAVAYAELDGGLSERACQLMVSNGEIRDRLKLIPEEELPAVAYRTYQNPPEHMAELLQMCGQKYPKLR